MERVLGTSAYSRARDRPTRIVRMLLQDFIGRNPRDTCEDYFQDFCRMASCFEDLRPHVQRLTPEEAQLFFNFSCAKLKEVCDGKTFQDYDMPGLTGHRFRMYHGMLCQSSISTSSLTTSTSQERCWSQLCTLSSHSSNRTSRCLQSATTSILGVSTYLSRSAHSFQADILCVF